MLCFDKLTGEYNNKKQFQIFSFCGSISLKVCINKKERLMVHAQITKCKGLICVGQEICESQNVVGVYSNRLLSERLHLT